jgi:hypothetical protein
MLLFGLFLLIFSALVLSDFPIINGYPCPQEDIESTQCRGPKDCLYPHPEDCSRFVQCNAAALAYDMPCPPGNLHWNDHTKECDYPQNAGCEGHISSSKAALKLSSSQSSPQDEPTLLSPPTDGKPRLDFDCVLAELEDGCPDSLGAACLYAATDSCTSYIQCVDLVAWEVPCESGGAWGLGTVWDNEVRACVEPKESIRCTL